MDKPVFYGLNDDGEPTPVDTYDKFGPQWFQIQTKVGPYMVSTVFLGVDHGFGDVSLWFETMVFDEGVSTAWGPRRYQTKQKAIEGHNWCVDRLRGDKLEM